MSFKLALGLFKRKDVLLVCLLMPIVIFLVGGGIGIVIYKILGINSKVLKYLPFIVSLVLGAIYIANIIRWKNESEINEDNDSGKITLHKAKGIFIGISLEILFIVSMLLGLMLLVLAGDNLSVSNVLNNINLEVIDMVLGSTILWVMGSLLLASISLIVCRFIKPIGIESNNSFGIIDIIMVICLAILTHNIGSEIITIIFGKSISSISMVFLAIVPLVYSKVMKLDIRETFNFNFPRFKYIFIGILLWVLCFIIRLAIIGLVQYLFPGILNGTPVENMFAKWSVIGQIIFIALIPAVCEEILYRGFIFGTLNKLSGHKTAIIVSSILFGLIHIHPLKIFYSGISGLLYGYMVHKSKSIAVSMILHFINNSLMILAMNY